VRKTHLSGVEVNIGLSTRKIQITEKDRRRFSFFVFEKSRMNERESRRTHAAFLRALSCLVKVYPTEEVL